MVTQQELQSAYETGFTRKCAEHGTTAAQLRKQALSSALINRAAPGIMGRANTAARSLIETAAQKGTHLGDFMSAVQPLEQRLQRFGSNFARANGPAAGPALDRLAANAPDRAPVSDAFARVLAKLQAQM